MSGCCEKKVISKKVFLIIISFVVALISYESFASGDHGKMQKSMKHGNRKMLDMQTRKSVLLVLEENEALHNSFFEYNAKSVEKAAKKLKAKIKNISNPEISKLLKFSITKLDEIQSNNERKKNNQNYHLVSMALIHLINTYEVGSKYNTYSCPMVKKKWLQNSEKLTKVYNPYVKNMPHCGSEDANH